MKSLKDIIDSIANETCLKYVDLPNQKIDDASAQALADALKKNKNLAVLNLSGTGMSISGIKALAGALKTNKTLTSLMLGRNNLGDEEAIVLAEGLKDNTGLISLDLLNNGIKDEGAKALAEALKTHKTLLELGLNHNQIADLGTQAIADMLLENRTLDRLVLSSNKIGDLGARALAGVLKSNQTLTRLHLDDNDVPVEATKVLIKALKDNMALRVLILWDIRDKSKGDAEFLSVLDLLEESWIDNITISELSLSTNDRNCIDKLFSQKRDDGKKRTFNCLRMDNEKLSKLVTDIAPFVSHMDRGRSWKPKPKPSANSNSSTSGSMSSSALSIASSSSSSSAYPVTFSNSAAAVAIEPPVSSNNSALMDSKKKAEEGLEVVDHKGNQELLMQKKAALRLQYEQFKKLLPGFMAGVKSLRSNRNSLFYLDKIPLVEERILSILFDLCHKMRIEGQASEEINCLGFIAIKYLKPNVFYLEQTAMFFADAINDERLHPLHDNFEEMCSIIFKSNDELFKTKLTKFEEICQKQCQDLCLPALLFPTAPVALPVATALSGSSNSSSSSSASSSSSSSSSDNARIPGLDSETSTPEQQANQQEPSKPGAKIGQ